MLSRAGCMEIHGGHRVFPAFCRESVLLQRSIRYRGARKQALRYRKRQGKDCLTESESWKRSLDAKVLHPLGESYVMTGDSSKSVLKPSASGAAKVIAHGVSDAHQRRLQSVPIDLALNQLTNYLCLCVTSLE